MKSKSEARRLATGRLLTALAAVLVVSGCVGPRRDRFRYDRVAATAAECNARSPERDAGSSKISGAPLDLRSAVELARAGNPDIRIALASLRQAEAARRAVSAAFLPVLALDTGYLRADAPSQALFKSIDARRLAPGTDFNDPGDFENFETGLTARYNLYRGGQDALDSWIAQAGEDISRLDLSAVRNGVVAAVIVAYYDVLMADELIETAVASVATVRAQLRESEAKWKAGNALKSDVLSLEVRAAEAEERRIRAENAAKLAVAALANLLGLDADAQLELADPDAPSETQAAVVPEAAHLPATYEDALAEALTRRPELHRARRFVERSALQHSKSRRTFLPRVDAEARAYWDDSQFEYDDNRTNWFVGVNLSWDLFTGGRRTAGVERTRALLNEMLEADRRQTLAVQLDVKSAVLRLEEARERLRVSDTSVAQADDSLDLVREQYEGGTAAVTRYLEAEFDLTRARMRRTNAAFDLRKAQADVARGIGRFADATPDTEE